MHLQLCMDRGPEGVCGANCLLYSPEIRANVTCWFDESHDLENDLYGMFKSMKLYPFMLVMCVVMNLGHGCERDRDLRYWQFVDLMKFVFESFEPGNCESYQSRCTDMLQELDRKVPLDGVLSPMESLWEFEKNRAARPYLNERVNMVRFLSWPAAGRELLSEWTSLLWKVELLCIECDWVSSAQFKQKIALHSRRLEEEEANRNSTASNIPSIDGKVVRQACQNACVIALGLLEETSHKRLLALMVHISQPIMDFRGAHARQCRDVEGTLTWASELVDGGLIEQVGVIFGTLASVRRTESLAYELEFDKALDRDDPRIQGEDEWAQMHGNMVLSLIGRRLKRKLYMFGLPHRHVVLVRQRGRTEHFMKELRADITAKEVLEMQPDTKAKQILLERSLLNTTAVKQCIACCKSMGWRAPTSRDPNPLADLAQDTMQGAMATLMCEELIGFGKNSKKQRGATVFRKPEVSMAMMLGNEVPAKRFKYQTIDDSSAPPSKRQRLLPEAFGRGAAKGTVSYKGLISTAAKPPWFSPAATQIGINTADLALLRYAEATKQHSQLDNAFLSCMANGEPFVFKRVVKPEEEDIESGWMVGLANFGDSAAIVWPVSLDLIPFYESTDMRIVNFKAKIRSPELMGILTWKNLRAIPFTWRSPAWFKANCPLTPQSFHGEVRAIARLNDEGDLAEVAAKQSWWSLDLRDLKRIGNASLFNTSLYLTCKVLGLEEEDALAYLGGRIRAQDDPEGVNQFLEIEEASNLLHKNDEEDLQKEKKRQVAERDSDNTFRREYSEARAKHRQTRAEKTKPAARARGKAKAGATPTVLKIPPGDVIEMKDANLLKPPGSYVWRAWSHSAWEGRLPPHTAVRRSWTGGSAKLAFKNLLEKLWTQYLTDEKLEIKDCPVQGLFGS